MRRIRRTLRLLVHLAWGVVLALRIQAQPVLGTVPVQVWAERWFTQLLAVLGVEWQRPATPIAGALIVANHQSWLDIALLGAMGQVRFVAKREIQNWPVAGTLANAVGTLYIHRGTGGSRPLLERLRPLLAGGASVVIFPEGTTSAGPGILPFHARLFEAAIDTHCKVQPVALAYSTDATGKAVAPFVGNDHLVGHIWRLLGATGVQARVLAGPLLSATDYPHRQALAAAAGAWVAAQMPALAVSLAQPGVVDAALPIAPPQSPR